MLVLSRRPEESIMIGDDIEVKVLSVHGEGPRAVVRLGITSPREKLILRKELYVEIQGENRAAMASSLSPAALRKLGFEDRGDGNGQSTPQS